MKTAMELLGDDWGVCDKEKEIFYAHEVELIIMRAREEERFRCLAWHMVPRTKDFMRYVEDGIVTGEEPPADAKSLALKAVKP